MKALIAIDGSPESSQCRGHGGQPRLAAGIPARDPDRRTDGCRSVRRAVRRIRGLRPDGRAPPANEERARRDPEPGGCASWTRRPRRQCAEPGRRACIDDRRGGRLDVRRPHHPRGPWSRRRRARPDRLGLVRGGRSCALPRPRRAWRSDAQDPHRNRRLGPGDVRGVVRRRVRSVSSRPRSGSSTPWTSIRPGGSVFAADECLDRFGRRMPLPSPRVANMPPRSRRWRVMRWRRSGFRSAAASGRVARPRSSWTRRQTWHADLVVVGTRGHGISRRWSSGARRDPCFSDRRASVLITRGSPTGGQAADRDVRLCFRRTSPRVVSADADRFAGGGGGRRPLGRSRLRPLRGRDAVGAARRDGCPRRRPPRRDGGPPPHRGSGSAPRTGDGGSLPAPGAVRRPEREEGRQRGTRRLRPGLPLGHPAAVREPGAAARRGARQRHAARRARLLLARHERRGDARRDPGREDGRRPAQSLDAQDARRELHPRRRHRPGRRGRRPAVRPRRPDDRRGRAADRRARRRAGPGPRDAPARDRRDPVGNRDGPDRQARSRHPHRDVHRRGRRPGRGRRRHRRRQGAEPGQDRDDVPDGLAAPLRVRPRQPDGRDAGRSTSRTTRTSSARSAGWSRSTPPSRST